MKATRKNLYLDQPSTHVDDYDKPVIDQISAWMKDMKMIEENALRKVIRNLIIEKGRHQFHGAGDAETLSQYKEVPGPKFGESNKGSTARPIPEEETKQAKEYIESNLPDELVAYSRGGAMVQTLPAAVYDDIKKIKYVAPAAKRGWTNAKIKKAPAGSEVWADSGDSLVSLKQAAQIAQEAGISAVNVWHDENLTSSVGQPRKDKPQKTNKWRGLGIGKHQKAADKGLKNVEKTLILNVDEILKAEESELPDWGTQRSDDDMVEKQWSWVNNKLKQESVRTYIRSVLLESLSGINAKIKRMIDEVSEHNALIDISTTGSGASVKITYFSDTRNNNWLMDAGHVYALYSGKYNPGNCNGAQLIGGVTLDSDGTSASYNMGPLLYDVLLEALTMKGATGFGPDYWSVSDDAYNLWDYYLKNRPDIIVKQRDIAQYPRTQTADDDCTDNYGYRAVAKRFPGGIKSAYGGNDPENDGENPGEKLSDEFIEHWFDPDNPLSKTYHQKIKGTPLINYLRANYQLTPQGAESIGAPYDQKDLESLWDNTYGKIYPAGHRKIPHISNIWKNSYGFDNSHLLDGFEYVGAEPFYNGVTAAGGYGRQMTIDQAREKAKIDAAKLKQRNIEYKKFESELAKYNPNRDSQITIDGKEYWTAHLGNGVVGVLPSTEYRHQPANKFTPIKDI